MKWRVTTGYLMISCLYMNTSAIAQVEVKEKIVLTGATPADRQIKGLAYPDSASSAISASSVISGQLIYDVASGTDTLYLEFSPAPPTYARGMQLNFKSPSINHNGPVWINVNGLGLKQLVKNVNQPLDSAEILAGQIISAIYDGSAFQVTSKLNRPCPWGFVDVNDNYCIQQNENPTIGFYIAMKDCGDKNAALCTWSEWYYACQKTSLGLSNMNDNFEWIGDAANYTSSQVNARVAGSPTCQNPASIALTAASNKPYRCCYRKK